MSRDLGHRLRDGLGATPFCPGCGHGILLGAVARALDLAGVPEDRLLVVSGIGCAAWIPSPHLRADTLHTLHGRALAFATGAKMYNPELVTLVVSGDGDLASIGGNHLIHAARRDLDVTVVCANNAIYGMTGGQVAATTPAGARTATTPAGNPHRPFDLCRLVAAAGASYVARYAVVQPDRLARAIARGIGTPGFAFVEAVSPCPTQYGRRNDEADPAEALRRLRDRIVPREEAEALGPEALADRIVVGEFVP